MTARNWALLLFLSLLWGGSFFFYKILVAVLPPVTVVAGRVAIAAIALNLWLWARGTPLPLSRPLWKRFALLGILNNVVPFILVAWGETRIDSGLAGVLNAVTPIFIVLVAHFTTTDEKISAAKLAGVGFGFAGTVVLVGPAAFQFRSGGAEGELAVLLAAFIYALGALYGRRFRDVPPIQTATGQITAALIILFPLSLLLDRPWTLPMPGPEIWAALFGIALLSTALAYVLFYRLLAIATATVVSLVAFLMPVHALWLGALFLDEAVTLQSLAGMALIGLGLVAIDGRLVARFAFRSRAE
jgi:drug/metabolite transporter (DMT)-like permease